MSHSPEKWWLPAPNSPFHPCSPPNSPKAETVTLINRLLHLAEHRPPPPSHRWDTITTLRKEFSDSMIFDGVTVRVDYAMKFRGGANTTKRALRKAATAPAKKQKVLPPQRQGERRSVRQGERRSVRRKSAPLRGAEVAAVDAQAQAQAEERKKEMADMVNQRRNGPGVKFVDGLPEGIPFSPVRAGGDDGNEADDDGDNDDDDGDNLFVDDGSGVRFVNFSSAKHDWGSGSGAPASASGAPASASGAPASASGAPASASRAPASASGASTSWPRALPSAGPFGRASVVPTPPGRDDPAPPGAPLLGLNTGCLPPLSRAPPSRIPSAPAFLRRAGETGAIPAPSSVPPASTGLLDSVGGLSLGDGDDMVVDGAGHKDDDSVVLVSDGSDDGKGGGGDGGDDDDDGDDDESDESDECIFIE